MCNFKPIGAVIYTFSDFGKNTLCCDDNQTGNGNGDRFREILSVGQSWPKSAECGRARLARPLLSFWKHNLLLLMLAQDSHLVPKEEIQTLSLPSLLLL